MSCCRKIVRVPKPRGTVHHGGGFPPRSKQRFVLGQAARSRGDHRQQLHKDTGRSLSVQPGTLLQMAHAQTGRFNGEATAQRSQHNKLADQLVETVAHR